MSHLANLSEEECSLLTELVEAEHRRLQSGSPKGPKDTSHRHALVADLLWQLQVARSSRGAINPADVADERPAGYS